MRKGITLIISFILSLTIYSQDFKVEKLKIVTKGNNQINRVLIITKPVPNDGDKIVTRQNAVGQVILDTIHYAGINKFILDFTSALKVEFEKYELDLIIFEEVVYDYVESEKTLMETINPNGILTFNLSNSFLEYRGFTQKNGVYFDLGLSYRTNSKDKYIPLYSTKIKVMIDSFENSGELAAKDFFSKMKKAKNLELKK